MKGFAKGVSKFLKNRSKSSKDTGNEDTNVDQTDSSSGGVKSDTSNIESTKTDKDDPIKSTSLGDNAVDEISNRFLIIDDMKSMDKKVQSLKNMIRDLVNEKFVNKKQASVNAERSEQRITDLERKLVVAHHSQILGIEEKDENKTKKKDTHKDDTDKDNNDKKDDNDKKDKDDKDDDSSSRSASPLPEFNFKLKPDNHLSEHENEVDGLLTKAEQTIKRLEHDKQELINNNRKLGKTNETMKRDIEGLQETNQSQSSHVQLLESERQAIAERTAQGLQAKLAAANDQLKVYAKFMLEVSELPGRKVKLIKRECDAQLKSRDAQLSQTLGSIKRETAERRVNRDRLVKLLGERESQMALLLDEFEATVGELELSKDAQSKISQTKDHYQIMLKEVESILADRDEELRIARLKYQSEFDLLKRAKDEITADEADKMVHTAIDATTATVQFLDEIASEVEALIENDRGIEKIKRDHPATTNLIVKLLDTIRTFLTSRSKQIKTDPSWILSQASFQSYDSEIAEAFQNQSSFLVAGTATVSPHVQTNVPNHEDDDGILDAITENNTNPNGLFGKSSAFTPTGRNIDHSGNKVSDGMLPIDGSESRPVSPSISIHESPRRLQAEIERKQMKALLMESKREVKELKEKLSAECALKNAAEKARKTMQVRYKELINNQNHTKGEDTIINASMEDTTKFKGLDEAKAKWQQDKQALLDKLHVSTNEVKSLKDELTRVSSMYRSRESKLAENMEMKLKMLEEKIRQGHSNGHDSPSSKRTPSSGSKNKTASYSKESRTPFSTTYTGSTTKYNASNQSFSPGDGDDGYHVTVGVVHPPSPEQIKEREKMLHMVAEARSKMEKKMNQADAENKRLKNLLRAKSDEILQLKRINAGNN